MLTLRTQLKYIQSLGHKKQRDADQVFLAEGPKIVSELLHAADTDVLEIYALAEWIKKNNDGPAAHLHVQEVTEQELERISQLTTPNQVLAVVRQWKEKALPQVPGGWLLALDGIQDPGNLGTIIRIADWFGVAGIVCNQLCADRYNPKVVQATMGSIARVPVWYTDLPAWLAGEQAAGTRIYGALLNGMAVEKVAQPAAGILVIGNESRGITPEIEALVSVKLTISRKGQAESLNAAVAAGVLLSHLV